MKHLMNGFFVRSSLVLAASAVGFLVGVERLLQTQVPDRTMNARPVEEQGVMDAVAAVEPLPVTTAAQEFSAEETFRNPEPAKTDRHFSIKRTKSEIGYVYWILEGYGKYKCFVLCDSWDEAVAKAKARMAGDDMEERDSFDASEESILSVAAGSD